MESDLCPQDLAKFSQIYDHILPNQDAYNFIPTGEDVKIGSKVKAMRKIFGGETEYDDFEKEKLAEFEAFLKTKNWSLPEDWDQTELLRILEGYKYKSKDAWKGIKSHTEWRSQYMPPVLTKQGADLLQNGFMYIHGRDQHSRPILVMNIRMFADAYKAKVDPEVLMHSSFHLLEYVKEHMLIPGKVENWVVIQDFSDLKTKDIPFGLLKKVLLMLQNNYRNCLALSYGVNVPSFVYNMWNILKHFLDKFTTDKVRMFRAGCQEELLKHCDASQIEEKFGGSAANVTDNFWPPVNLNTYPVVNNEMVNSIPHKTLTLVSAKCAAPGDATGNGKDEETKVSDTPDDGNTANHNEVTPNINGGGDELAPKAGGEGEDTYDSEKILRRDTGFYNTGNTGSMMINVISHKVTEDQLDKSFEESGEKQEKLDLGLIRKETERKLEALSRRSTSKIQFEIGEELPGEGEDSDEELRKVEELLARKQKKPINDGTSTVEGAEAASNTGGFCGMCRGRPGPNEESTGGKCVIM